MAWPLDQPTWEQDQIYGNPLADASDLIPLFVPDIESTVALDYRGYLNPPTNEPHYLGHGNPYHAMSSSSSPQRAAIASPNIPTPNSDVMNEPHSTGNQSPIVSASRHPGTKPRIRKKNSSRVTDSCTQSRPATTFECKWAGCQYVGSFNREHELLRHLRTIHIAPLAHSCPVEGCGKVCNREDNLLQHMKNRHGSW